MTTEHTVTSCSLARDAGIPDGSMASFRKRYSAGCGVNDPLVFELMQNEIRPLPHSGQPIKVNAEWAADWLSRYLLSKYGPRDKEEVETTVVGGVDLGIKLHPECCCKAGRMTTRCPKRVSDPADHGPYCKMYGRALDFYGSSHGTAERLDVCKREEDWNDHEWERVSYCVPVQGDCAGSEAV